MHRDARRAARQRVAIANHRNEVLIGDVASGELRVVDRSDDGRTEDLAWSPDGAWLAYTFWTEHAARARSSCTTSRRSTQHARHAARVPRLLARRSIPTGKYLYFLSLRTFDPVYDSVQFELSFPRAARPYLIALQAGGAAAVRSGAEGPEARASRDAAATRPTPTPRAAPRRPRRHRAPRRGVSGAREPLRPDRRRRRRQGAVDACCRSSARTAAAATRKRPGTARALRLRHAAHRDAAREGRRLRAGARRHDAGLCATASACARSPPTRKPGKPEPGEQRRRAVAQERLDRPRAACASRSSRAREWRQMLREVWRLQRDQFWVGRHVGRRLGGGLRAATRRCSTRVATRGELSDLIWEMQGELGTSHAYEMGGDHRKPPAVALGHLGAELRFDADGGSYEITRIVARRPVGRRRRFAAQRRSASRRRSGERIVAVNGQPVSRDRAAAGAARPPGRHQGAS